MEKVKGKLKGKWIALIAAVVLILCALPVGFYVLGQENIKEVMSQDKYEYVNPDETKAEADEGFKIDGVFDEEAYKNNTWLYLENAAGGSNVNIAMTSFFGEKGMYFAYDVDEKTPIYVNLDRPAYLNSSIEMYLAPGYLTSLRGNSAFEINMLPTGELSFKKSNGKGGWTNVASTNDIMAYLGTSLKGGEVNTPDCKGYTLELFIPWSYMERLEIDVEAIKAGHVYVNPAHITSFNETGTDTNVDRYHYWFAQQLGAGWNDVANFFRFDSKGSQGAIATEMVQGEHYTITGPSHVLAGLKNTYTITPKEGYALNSLLVNGEEYIKDISFLEDGSAVVTLRGKAKGLKISADTEAITEGNKSLSVHVFSNKPGGDSLKDANIICKGPDGFEDITVDSNGKFTIPEGRQGLYTISVEKEDYAKVVRTIYLNRNAETNLVLDYDRFEVVSGNAWILDDQNKGLLYKFGGNNAVILTKDLYKDFEIKANFYYDTELAKLNAADGFVQQRQGYRVAFANGKIWHIDILKEKDRFILQYAKFSGDNSLTNWENIYVLSQEEIAKLSSSEGMEFAIQRSGRTVNFLLDGKVVANEYLGAEYEDLEAKIGFEGWVLNRTIQEIPFSITSDVNITTSDIKVTPGWDLSKMEEGMITVVGGSGSNGEFSNFTETFLDTYREVSMTAKDVVNDGKYSLIYRFSFRNGQTYYVRLQNSKKEQIVQVMGSGNSFTDRWDTVYRLSKAQITKLTTEGLEFRTAIIGEEAVFFLDGIEVGSRDISKTKDGKPSNVGKDTATIGIRMDGNVGETITMAIQLKEVALNIANTRYGVITTDKDNYKVGDTIVVTAKNSDGTYCTEMILDGKTIQLDEKGSYSFTAQLAGHSMEGIFKGKEIFAFTEAWDLAKEQAGIISVMGGNAGGLTSATVSTKDNHYRDVAVTAKDLSDTELFSLLVFWNFDNGDKYVARIVEEKSRVIVQAMPINNSFLEKNHWDTIGVLTTAQAAKLRESGVELRMALVGETMHFLVDGSLVGSRDLTKRADGTDSNLAETTAEIQLRVDGNVGIKTEVGFKLHQVAIVNGATRLGTITLDKATYVPGEKVVLTAKNSDGTYCKEIILDGKKIKLDAKGSYTFTAKVSGHTLEGVFNREEIFAFTDSWDLSKEQNGIISVLGGNAGKGTSTLVSTKDNTYRDVTVEVKDLKADGKFSSIIIWKFDNGEIYAARLVDEEGKRLTVQAVPLFGNTFLGKNDAGQDIWDRIVKLSDAHAAKLKTEGLSLRMALLEETMQFYVDGELVGTRDLSKNAEGKSTELNKAAAQIQFRIDGNEGLTTEVGFALQKVAIINPTDKYGKVETDKDSYVPGETITVTATNKDGSVCDMLLVDGKKVDLDEKGQYSFTASIAGHVLGGIFKEKDYFKETEGWNLKEQSTGVVSVVGKDTYTTNLITLENIYKGITVNVRDNDADTKGFAAQLTFVFTNGEKLSVRLHNNEGDAAVGGNYRIQLMDDTGDSFVTAWSSIYTLNSDEVAKIRSEAGVDFTLLVVGEELRAYIDGAQVGSYDLSKNQDGKTTNMTDATATIGLRIYANEAYNNVVDFKLHEVAVDASSDKNGSLEMDSDAYDLYDKISFTVKPNAGYYCSAITVNGETVELDSKGSYSFEATEVNYKVEASFKKTVFAANSEWNLTNEHFGILSVPATTDGYTGWLETLRSYTEVSAVAKYYAHTSNSVPYALVESFKFENGKNVSIRLTNADGKWKLQSMNDSVFGWTNHYSLSNEEIQSIKGDGIEFKLVRKGTKLDIYLGGKLVKADLDLTGNNSGITADTDATVRLALYENKGYETVVPYSLAGGPEKIKLNISAMTNGSVKPQEDEYYVGDTVILDVVGDTGYVSSDLKIDGTAVSIDKDGSYSFEAEKTSYNVEASFVKSLFTDNTSWNKVWENKGTLLIPSNENGYSGWVQTLGSYDRVAATVQYHGHTSQPFAFVESFVFENGKNVTIRLTNDGDTWKIQSMSDSVFYWSQHYVLTEDEIAAIKGDGIRFELVRKGTKLDIYLGGKRVKHNLDLTNYVKDNTPTGITKDMKATVRMALYENKGVETVIPFELGQAPEQVTMNITNGANGTIVVGDVYLGDIVELKAVGSTGYYAKSLMLDGTPVEIKADGSYSFEAAKNSYTVKATFAKAVFDSTSGINGWIITDQDTGVIKTDGNVSTGFIKTLEKYSTVSVKIHNPGVANVENTTYAFHIQYHFDNGKMVDIQVCEWNGSYFIKSADAGSIYTANKDYIRLSAEMANKIESTGIDLKIVHSGNRMFIYIDNVLQNMFSGFHGGNQFIDLTKDKDGNANGYDFSNAKAQIAFKSTKISATEVPAEKTVAFTLSNEVDKAEVDMTYVQTLEGNGKIQFVYPNDKKTVYTGNDFVVGQTVMFTIADGYYTGSLKVNDTEVKLDDATGTYSFVAQKNNSIETDINNGLFDTSDANSLKNWSIYNQASGIIKTTGTADTGKLMTIGDYSVVTVKLKNPITQNSGMTFGFHIQYKFDDGTVFDVQFLDWAGRYIMKSADTSLYGTNTEYWEAAAGSDIANAIEGDGITLKIVKNGTKVYFYVGNAEGKNYELQSMKSGVQGGNYYIDLSKSIAGNASSGANIGANEGGQIIFKALKQFTAGEVEFTLSNEIPKATFDRFGLDTTYGAVKLAFDESGNAILTATPQSGRYHNLKVNGESIMLDSNKTYRFVPREDAVNTITGSFDSSQWQTAADWDLTNQHVSGLGVSYTAQKSGTISSVLGDYSEMSVIFKDYLGQANSKADSATGKLEWAPAIVFKFDTDGDGVGDTNAGIRIVNNGGTYQIQGCASVINPFKWYASMKDAATITKIENQGVQLKLVRTGTQMKIYLDGVDTGKSIDLAKRTDNQAATGITADSKLVQVTIQHYGNPNCDIHMNVELKEASKATISTAGVDTTNGSLSFNKALSDYAVGERVVMTLNPNANYYHDLKLNGESILVDENNQYVFTAEASNTFTGDFKKSQWQSAADWDLTNQHVSGLGVSYTAQKSGTISSVLGDYSEMSVIFKDYLGQANSKADSATGKLEWAPAIVFKFDTDGDGVGDTNAGIRILNNGGTYQIQGCASVINPFKWYASMKDAATITKIENQGVQLKLVRTGTQMKIYLDGVDTGKSIDLAKRTDNQAATGITADSKLVQVTIQHYGNPNCDIEMPYTLGKETVEANWNLQSVLAGKKLSILGDSISTYAGVSNDAANTNNTIAGNAVHYTGSNILYNADLTWWKKSMSKTGMDLLVNNSWAGDKVLKKGQDRCVQLHDNTGDNTGMMPDVIAVYLGINDYDGGTSTAEFKTSYDTMIGKLVAKYPDADVFLFNFVPNKANSRPVTDMEAYNAAVKEIADKYGCNVVDLYANSGITASNVTKYMGDGVALHPNALGMEAISEAFLHALYEKYIFPNVK